MKTSKKFKIYREVRRELSLVYPCAFPRKGKRVPLKTGILRDILDDQQTELPSGKIRLFLSIWTRSTSYLQSVSKSNFRINLNGQPCEELLKNHMKEAENKIRGRAQKKINKLTSLNIRDKEHTIQSEVL